MLSQPKCALVGALLAIYRVANNVPKDVGVVKYV